MTEPTTHAESWRDYRARWIWFLSVWAGGFALLSMLMMILPSLLGDAGVWITVLIGVAWALAFCVVMVRLLWFACPRCRKPFSLLFYLIWWPLSGKCLHCGLPRGE
ncbi:hypothetical protein [Lysobacter sp. CA199]|uniref:hypothetical protein n=1 Tax=Lysobacter sp. CA199 TaxID=3455608 RepID=UPI003F8D458E